MDGSNFSIGEVPVPASRPRVTKTGRTFYPKKHESYRVVLDNLMKDFTPMGIEGPVEVRFLFVMPPYKTSDYPVHRADVDNLAKLPMDCMTKSERFYTDDNLVVDLRCFKRFCREGEEPHTKVMVREVAGSIEDHVDKAFEA